MKITIRFLILLVSALLPFSGYPFESLANLGTRGNLNRDSRFCLGCHDGTLATNIISQDLNGVWGIFRKEMPKDFCLDRGHPVGIDYRLAQLRSQGRLKDPSLIAPAIKLENGQVGCTSCHDPNSQHRARLVMNNTGSRLCFACHNL